MNTNVYPVDIHIEPTDQQVREFLPRLREEMQQRGVTFSGPDEFLLSFARQELAKRLKREAFAQQFRTEPIAPQANRWRTARQCGCQGSDAKTACPSCGWAACAACRRDGRCPACGLTAENLGEMAIRRSP